MAFFIVGAVLVCFFLALVYSPWYIGLVILIAMFGIHKFLKFSHKCAEEQEAKFHP